LRALLQRISHAKVSVEDEVVGQSGPGLLILVCAMRGDEEDDARALANKISKLRIFKDTAGKMNRSLLDVGGSALVVSQFTLAADTSSGNRPGFSAAARPEIGEHLYKVFSQHLNSHGIAVETGQFGADMAVELVNDGPVTFWMEN